MIRKQGGFTLIELMITIAVFLFVISAASGIFTSLLTQFKQQGAILETNIEGIVGLEMLRQDLEQAGYGVPWAGLVAYTESDGNPFNLDDAPANPPRAVVSANNVTFAGPNNIFSGTDYLVVKAVNVTRNPASEKWTEVKDPAKVPYSYPVNPRVWTKFDGTKDDTQTLADEDRVIVFRGATKGTERSLVTNGDAFYTTYSSVTTAPWGPDEENETRIVYGINSNTDSAPVRPFNRADYFIRRFDNGGTDITPRRCAPNTGVLFKASMNHDHDAAGTFTYLPLLDCVADFQVDFWLDTDNPPDGNVNWPPRNDISGLTAGEIRDQLKEIRVYVVAHEGRRDTTYDFSMNNTRTFLSATEVMGVNSQTVNFVDLKGLVGDPEYKYYRWKLYVLSVKPDNLN